MSRNEYLERPAVSDFVDYLAEVMTGEISVGEFWPGFDQKFGVKRPTDEWLLQDLFANYKWKGNLAEATSRLRPLRRALRVASSKDAKPAVLVVSMKGIFDWGMDRRSARKNHKWALDQGERIVDLYLEASVELASDQPDYTVFDRARMNAGYTKVYAIPSLSTIIYDSRVAAGFCWLIRRFLLAHPEHLVNGLPGDLKFGLPSGLGAVLRNPSCEAIEFPAIGGSRSWAKSNVQASWIITAALEKAGSLSWCRGRFALRRVEAGLFMLGYRIDPENKGRPASITNAKDRARAGGAAPTGSAIVWPVAERSPAVSFDVAYERLSREPNATVALKTVRGTAFTASARVGRDNAPKIRFPHSNSVKREDWGARINGSGQRVGQYTDAVVRWATELG